MTLWLLLLCPMELPGRFSSVEIAVPLCPQPGPHVMTAFTDCITVDFVWVEDKGYEISCINHRLEIVGPTLDPKRVDSLRNRVNAASFMGVPAGRLKFTFVVFTRCDRGHGREPETDLKFEEALPGDLDFEGERVDFTVLLPLVRGMQ
jgi:hypothetical protein